MQHLAQILRENCNDLDASYDGNDDKPEPEEDVNLLVDDVEGQNANAVKLLNASGGSELVKSALGDLDGERVTTSGIIYF